MTDRILIIEDEVVIAMEIESVLQQLGYLVAGSATTGEDAIKRAAETRPDLILMDIRLTGELDGITAADQIYRRYKIPVIFLSAHSDQNTLKRALAAHPFGYLIKPFRKNELYTSIEIALSSYRTLVAEQASKMEIFRANVIDHIVQHDIFSKTLALSKYLEQFLGDTPPTDTGQECVRNAQNLVQHIRDHICRGGDYNSPGNTGAQWQNIQQMIEGAADAVLPVQVKVENEIGTLEIITDPLFSRVFYYLFENSCRYGRTVSRIRITFDARDGEGIISIEDNGVGITDGGKPSLFSDECRHGNGDGLFLVREILQINGMTVRRKSTSGERSRVEIVIPEGLFRNDAGVV